MGRMGLVCRRVFRRYPDGQLNGAELNNRKRNGSVFKLIMTYLICFLVISVLVLPLIQRLYSSACPWDANGLLGYLGALVGSVSTIVALYFSLLSGREDRKHSDEMGVLPCIALSRLSKKPIRFIVDQCINGISAKDDPKDNKHDSGWLNRVDYILLDDGKSAVPSKEYPLDDENDNRYVLSSVGLGPAVNVKVGIARENELDHCGVPDISWCQTRQLPLDAESELVICFTGRLKNLSNAGYRIVVSYLDILGNQYAQLFPMTFDEQDGVLGFSVNYAVNRIKVS